MKGWHTTFHLRNSHVRLRIASSGAPPLLETCQSRLQVVEETSRSHPVDHPVIE